MSLRPAFRGRKSHETPSFEEELFSSNKEKKKKKGKNEREAFLINLQRNDHPEVACKIISRAFRMLKLAGVGRNKKLKKRCYRKVINGRDY